MQTRNTFALYWTGKNHSEETKVKMKEPYKGIHIGDWITDRVSSKKIKRDDPIPNGWTRGRKIPLQKSKK